MTTESVALTSEQRLGLLNHEVARFALEGWSVSRVSREFSHPPDTLLTIKMWAPSGSNRRPKD